MTEFKECKAWAVVDRRGALKWSDGLPLIFKKEQDATDDILSNTFNPKNAGERVVRVRIVRDEG